MSNLNWPTIAIQGIILGNIAILAQKGLNGFLIFSGLIIITLFILQSLSRRFFLLFPINRFMNEPVPSIDTYLIKILSFLFLLSFFLGLLIAHEYPSCILIEIEKFLLSKLVILITVLVFLVLLPGFWLVCLEKFSKKSITNKLKRSEYKYCPDPFKLCPNCQKILIAENIVTSDNEEKIIVKTIFSCENCGEKFECPVKLNIAY